MKASDFANAVEMKDTRGTKLRAGQTVVFNQSGVLRVGEIIKFKGRKNKSHYSLGVNIHVLPDGESKLAVVREPWSILVLKEDCLDCISETSPEAAVALSQPNYFEDYEECGYCHRPPFGKHKGSCRQ